MAQHHQHLFPFTTDELIVLEHFIEAIQEADRRKLTRVTIPLNQSLREFAAKVSKRNIVTQNEEI